MNDQDNAAIRAALDARLILAANMPRIQGTFATAAQEVTRAWTRVVESFRDAARTLHPFMQRVHDTLNAPVRVAGLCSRYQVRAGLDPAYASPEALSGLRRSILDRRNGPDDLRGLTAENRRLVAVSAIRGWADSRG